LKTDFLVNFAFKDSVTNLQDTFLVHYKDEGLDLLRGIIAGFLQRIIRNT